MKGDAVWSVGATVSRTYGAWAMRENCRKEKFENKAVGFMINSPMAAYTLGVWLCLARTFGQYATVASVCFGAANIEDQIFIMYEEMTIEMMMRY